MIYRNRRKFTIRDGLEWVIILGVISLSAVILNSSFSCSCRSHERNIPNNRAEVNDTYQESADKNLVLEKKFQYEKVVKSK